MKTDGLFRTTGANTCLNLSPLFPPQLKIVFPTDTFAAFLFSSVSVSPIPVTTSKLNDYVAQGWESQSACVAENAQPTFALVIPAGNVSITIGSPLLLAWSCRKNVFQGPLYFPATGVSPTTLPINFGLLASKQCVLQKTYTPTNGTQFWGMFQTSLCGPPPPSPREGNNSPSSSTSFILILIGVITAVVVLIGAVVIFFIHKRSLKKRKANPRGEGLKGSSSAKKGDDGDFSHDHAGHDEVHQPHSTNPLHRLSGTHMTRTSSL